MESDANNIALAISDYFSIPLRDRIVAGDQSFIPPTNGYTLTMTDGDTMVTITVTDASGVCPANYTQAHPVDAQGNGWLNGSTYQKRIRIN